jgi:hypothetical protein
MSDVSFAAGRSPLEIGVLITLVMIGLAGLLGFIAVIDADSAASAFGTAAGTTATVFLTGGTIACALACLKRRRAELAALGALVAAGLAMDLLVLAIWFEIDSEPYGKVTGVAFVWSFFALVVLGLALAVGSPDVISRALYRGTVVAAVCAGLIATWLIATAGSVFDPVEAIGDEGLLRALGAALVLLAALWFGALAVSRLERS